jgi:Na+-transporting NADH:ubiquinone oxidoreductase subunit C
MAKQQETIGRTLWVAFLLCLVCSVLVAGAAVALKPLQVENRLLDKQRSILQIAGLLTPEMDGDAIQALYAQRIEARLVDLQQGTFSEAQDVQRFDPLQAARDPELSDELSDGQDIASINRRERFSTVYLVEHEGQLETLIVPVRGYGLWSTLYGFIALKGDLQTVAGFGFYQHAETPGLGGEVDNPKWLGQWPGKQLFDADGQLAIQIIKGHVEANSANAAHQVDGLAGATLTSNGVNRLLHFWLGENGFGTFIAKLRAGEA